MLIITCCFQTQAVALPVTATEAPLSAPPAEKLSSNGEWRIHGIYENQCLKAGLRVLDEQWPPEGLQDAEHLGILHAKGVAGTVSLPIFFPFSSPFFFSFPDCSVFAVGFFQVPIFSVFFFSSAVSNYKKKRGDTVRETPSAKPRRTSVAETKG